MLFIHPSRDLAQIVTREHKVEFPKTALPGESFAFPADTFHAIRFNGQLPTPFAGNKLFFVAGLYANSPIRVTKQYYKPSRLNHPTHIWELGFIEIKRTPLEKGNKLKISKKVWEKVSADKELRKEQRKKVWKVLKAPNGEPQLNCWDPPLKSKIVSKFGSPRYLPSGKGYYHSGVDLRGWTGTPIQIPADGTVVMSEHMIVPGNTVILSHGGNIYSRYMHLNSIKVKLGENVKRGQIIGTSGSTGRVEGPHLHWEVRWKGHHADPHQFMTIWNQYCLRP